MSVSITVPTIITEAQYNDAFFAVTRSNANCYLLWENGTKCLWLDRNETNWKDFDPKTNDECDVSNEEVTNESGVWVEEECYICPTVKCCNRLDLNDLAKGEISWI